MRIIFICLVLGTCLLAVATSATYADNPIANAQQKALAARQQKEAADAAISAYLDSITNHADAVFFSAYEAMVKNGVKMMDLQDVQAANSALSYDTITPSAQSPQYGEDSVALLGDLGPIFEPVGGYRYVELHTSMRGMNDDGVDTSDVTNMGTPTATCAVSVMVGSGEIANYAWGLQNMPCAQFLAGKYDAKLLAEINEAAEDTLRPSS